ncbi:MAG: hypothetical protein AAB074_01495 [Planctomycetota bacterium]
MGKLGRLAVMALLCAGCGKAPSRPGADPPEEIYRKYVTACLATDGEAQCALLSERLRNEWESALAEIKRQPDSGISGLAKKLDSSTAAIRAAGLAQYTTIVLKSRMKDLAALARYRSLGPPRVFIQDKRVRVMASTPDDAFTWTLWLVEEAGRWRVDEEHGEESPAEVYRRFVAAYLAADGKTQWALLSERQRKLSEAALGEMKRNSDAQLDDLSRQLGTTPAEIRAAGPEELTTLVLKSRMKDPETVARFKSLGPAKAGAPGDRLRVMAATPDGKFTWSLWLIREGGQWKVDEEPDEMEVITPGGEK